MVILKKKRKKNFLHQKGFAPESEKTARLRRKIQEKWAVEKQKMDSRAIASAIERIKASLASNGDRVFVKKKQVMDLFACNRDSAPISTAVRKMACRIEQEWGTVSSLPLSSKTRNG